MSEVITMILLFAPLILIMLVANLAEARRRREEPYRGVALGSYALLVIFYAFAILIGIALQGFNTLLQQQPNLLQDLNLGGGGDNPFGQLDSLPLLGLSLWLPSLLGIILLLPPVRRLFARFIPLDPASPVHAVALSLSVLVLINLLFTLGIGLNNLAESLAAQEEAGVTSNTMLSLWTQQFMTAVFAFFGVGWLVRRDWGETLQRIGLVVPSLGNIITGIVLGLGMVPVVMVVDQLSARFNVGTDPGVDALTEQLLGPLFHTPFGIVTLGAAAALGEETLFRGALQPRFGYILTALLFALVHSNYGVSISTLIVFLLGLLLGVVRMRANTSTSMIVHAVYNMSLGFLAYLGV
ncbi:MAG: CPBP family intramembrane glutamic endopeptidase [Caldilineaceae bacterium]